MSSMEMILIVLLVGAVCAFFGKQANDKRNAARASSAEAKHADESAAARFTALLEEGETLDVVVPMDKKNSAYWAVSDKRIFIETKKGLEIVPYTQVRKLSMMDMGSRKTHNVASCFCLTIKTEDRKTFNLYDLAVTFNQAVNLIWDRTGL